MATGGKILNELQDEFCECPICTEEYDEDKHVPRLLPCQHSFCTECLTKGVRRNKLVCSMCKKSYNLKEKGIEIFPKDLTRRNLKDILERLAVNSCTVCQRLESVRFQCTVCTSNLCKACYKLRKPAKCKTHFFKEVRYDNNETPDSSLDSLETNDKNICTIQGHEHNKLKFYCKSKQCRKSICSNCTTKEHKNHDWEELDVVYSRQKDILLSRLSTVRKKLEAAIKVKSLYDNDLDQVVKNLNLETEKINQQKQEGIDFLNQESERICDTHTDNVEKAVGKLNKTLHFLNSYIENAQECCCISEQLLKENEASFLSVEKTILNKMEIFGSEIFEYKKCDVHIDVALMEEKYENLKRKVEILKKPTCNNVLTFTLVKDDEREGVSTTFFFLTIIACIAVLLFIFSEYKAWWNLPFCDMEICDDTTLSFTSSTNHSSFCRLEEEDRAGSFPIKTVGNQTCGNKESLFVYQGVFLNQTVSFFGRYGILRFYIRLSDISVSSTGKTVFKIGFSPNSIYKRTNEDGFEWGIRRSNDGEWIELLNPNNSLSARVSVATNAKLVLNYEIHLDNGTKTIQIVNRENKKALDTFYITEKYSSCNNIFFQLYEKSLAKISVKSLSKGVSFNPDSTYSNIYISKDNKTARNYESVEESSITRPLIQDIEVHNCTRLCVIPFTMWYPVLVSDINDGFQVYISSFDHSNEELLLSTMECSIYVSSVVEYVFSSIPKCLNPSPHLHEENSILPNHLFRKMQQFALIIDREKQTTTLKINFHKYTFPTPVLLDQRNFILRFEVYNQMELYIRLDRIKDFPYMYNVLNPFLNQSLLEICNFLMSISLVLFIIYCHYLLRKINRLLPP